MMELEDQADEPFRIRSAVPGMPYSKIRQPRLMDLNRPTASFTSTVI